MGTDGGSNWSLLVFKSDFLSKIETELLDI